MGQRACGCPSHKGPALKQVNPVIQCLLLPAVSDAQALALVNEPQQFVISLVTDGKFCFLTLEQTGKALYPGAVFHAFFQVGVLHAGHNRLIST
jgi:hypothetical protein